MNDEELAGYFKMGVSVTDVLYGFEDGKLLVFIQKIIENPYEGAWSFPGRLIEPHEGLEDVSQDLAFDSIGKGDVYLEQLNAFGKTYRHPLGRVIDIAFYGLINVRTEVIKLRNDREAKWVAVDELPELAFDHNKIFKLAQQRLKRRLINRPIGFKLLPKQFTLTEMQQLYEQVLGRELDKRNFRKKLNKLDILIAKGHDDSENPGRKPRLFMFNEENYENYMEMGF